MKKSVIGFPRVGKLRELKFATEKYFNKEINKEELEKVAKAIREENWKLQKAADIDYISSNDFSYYDGLLDTAVLLNVVPERYKQLKLNELDTYFAMARGYQGEAGDVKAFSMKKWFNTNYHYMVPEIDENTEIKLVGEKPFKEYVEAKELGIETKPVIIGAFTFLKLARYINGAEIENHIEAIATAYGEILERFNTLGVKLVQIDEPSLATDLTKEEIEIFKDLYTKILKNKGNTEILVQTYFNDVRDCYKEILALDFDAIGLDFLEGKETLNLVKENGFPRDKTLFAGIVNGKNIWKCNYGKALDLVNIIKKYSNNIVINTSCSLLHVPYTLDNEGKLDKEVVSYFAFAKEKLTELKELSEVAEELKYEDNKLFIENQKIFTGKRISENKAVIESVEKLTEVNFTRLPAREDRRSLQKEKYNLPILPTTTIGSFPQTIEVKKNRSKFRSGEISKCQYDENVKAFIKDCIKLQEELDLDVLVHGEYERNDMVEFFGENLEGYVFTEKAWVQSYGTRCVKPPIIFGDVKRGQAISVDYSVYAQSLTNKPVKGMLTGPVTILNWSFPREDISLKEMAFQIGLAIREEVLDLEAAGINIIQIDEAALKEKLPIRKAEWDSEYLSWAIKAFRLCHSGVKAETQIHTHMCYSEFDGIIKSIDDMDADVISFEASRAQLTILNSLNENNFETEVGPGVYDIHSPRVPSVKEIEEVIKSILTKIDRDVLWINPDCGLKTRGIYETKESLKNLVEATKNIRGV